jgi:uncharacterized membrane protein YeaQ/YmgE (transglycosylase-associated protein family)
MDWKVVLAWIITGSLVGWILSTILNTNLERALLIDIGLGILGALIAGVGLDLFSRIDVSQLDVQSIAVPLVGSLLVLMLFRILLGGRVDAV